MALYIVILVLLIPALWIVWTSVRGIKLTSKKR